MALSANTIRGLTRFLPGASGKQGAAVGRIVVWPPTTAPVYGSHMRPTAAPTGTAAKGDFYFDSTGNTLYTHDGTAFRQQIANTSTAQAITGTLAFPRVTKTAVATLTAADSGALCVFNSAAGDIYTLPVPTAGLWFDFVVVVTATSNNQKVITSQATEFLLGTFVQSTDGTYTSALQSANGSSIRAWTGNGSTTGGIKGDWFRVTAISATQWVIWGMGSATGSEATPFAAS